MQRCTVSPRPGADQLPRSFDIVAPPAAHRRPATPAAVRERDSFETPPKPCRSFKHETGAQDRLEFVGDAVLGVCVTAFLFHCLGADSRQAVRPEQLHNLKAVLVQNDTLAFLAVMWGLDRHLLYTDTHLGNGIAAFREVRAPSPQRAHRATACTAAAPAAFTVPAAVLLIVLACGASLAACCLRRPPACRAAAAQHQLLHLYVRI